MNSIYITISVSSLREEETSSVVTQLKDEKLGEVNGGS